MKFYFVFILLLLLAGCFKVPIHKEISYLSKEVEARTEIMPEWSNQISVNKLGIVSNTLNPPVAKTNSTISRKDAIRLALDNNKQIQARIQDLAVAKADFAQSNLFNNPYVSYEYYQHLCGETKGGYQSIIAFAITDYIHVPLKSRTGFKRLQQVAYEVIQDILGVIQNTEKTYNAIIYYQDIIKDKRAFVSRLSKAEKKLRSLGAKHYTLSKIDKNILKSDKLILETKIKLKIEKMNFERLLGIPGYKLRRMKFVDDLKVKIFKLPKTKDLLLKAYNYRPEIKALEKQVDYFDAMVLYEKSNIVRNLNAGVDLLNFPGSAGTRVDPLFASLSLPIFDQNIAQIDKNKFLLEKAKQLLLDMKEKIKQEVIEQIMIFKGLSVQNGYYKSRVDNAIKTSELHSKILAKTKSKKDALKIAANMLRDFISCDDYQTSMFKNYYTVHNCLTDLTRALGTTLNSPICPHVAELSCKKSKY